ncbi:hypothetical protein AC579_3012 [Pseudocercospora musae]|uniref:Uncharacterized protein n=1 Tax=Pseudocercospora musae TaxID=113226 RepID=A0A139I4I0_9PEZI|nr:hypothetical protein AC579_3012 [Pseudocercospora musae]
MGRVTFSDRVGCCSPELRRSVENGQILIMDCHHTSNRAWKRAVAAKGGTPVRTCNSTRVSPEAHSSLDVHLDMKQSTITKIHQ